MIISSNINYLCASAARRGKSVSVLGSNKGSMWVLLCVCVGVGGLGGGRLGVTGQVGFMFHSLLASVPFCLGGVLNVAMQRVPERFLWVCEPSLLSVCLMSSQEWLHLVGRQYFIFCRVRNSSRNLSRGYQSSVTLRRHVFSISTPTFLAITDTSLPA